MHCFADQCIAEIKLWLKPVPLRFLLTQGLSLGLIETYFERALAKVTFNNNGLNMLNLLHFAE